MSDLTTLRFRRVNRGQPYASDYYERSGEGLRLLRAHPSAEAGRYTYGYGAMVCTHDVEARCGPEEAKTRKQQLERLLHGIAERIESSRSPSPGCCSTAAAGGSRPARSRTTWRATPPSAPSGS